MRAGASVELPRLVAHGDEILAQLLRHGGRLLGDHGLLVHADNQGCKYGYGEILEF